MARSAEKAMAMLNRWHQMKHAIVSGPKGRRPRRVEESDSVKTCEYWRSQVVREVSRKISEIQNAGLGEHKIRDLNDQINQLLKEKQRWEERIKELGGPDYRTYALGVLDATGAELATQSGYKYFGAAKELPGVRELFRQETTGAAGAAKKTREQLYRNITPDYYGWRDEEEPDLLKAEMAREEELRRQAIEEWRTDRLMQLDKKLQSSATTGVT